MGYPEATARIASLEDIVEDLKEQLAHWEVLSMGKDRRIERLEWENRRLVERCVKAEDRARKLEAYLRGRISREGKK